MAVLPIVLYPDPVLLKPTRLVEKIDAEIAGLVADMAETMYTAPGIGLAANQVGVPLSIFIVDLGESASGEDLKVFINPVVVETEGRQRGDEGCLSFPEITLDVERPNRATFDALDLEGKPFRFTGEELMARVMLHEFDHLQGRVFLHNVSSLKRELVKKQIRKRIRSGEWISAEAM